MTTERVDEYYRWVLDRLKELLDTSPSNKPIRYELSHVAAAGVPNNETEENIVRKLAELGIVKIVGEHPRTWEYTHNGYFELLILQPQFDELCRKFGVIEEANNKIDVKPKAEEPKFLEIEDLSEDTLLPVWWVIKRVKNEYLATMEGEEVLLKFVPGEVIIAGNQRTIPDLEDQKLAVRLLQKMGAIKIKSDYFTPKGDNRFYVPKGQAPNGYYLDILQPRFDEIYKQSEKGNTSPRQQEEQIDLIQEDEPVEVISADLKALFSRVVAEQDEINFYFKIAAYGKYLIDHPQLNPILSNLYGQSKKDALGFLKIWGEFFELWKQLGQELVDLAEKNGIKGNPDILNQDLARLKQRLAEPDLSFYSGDLYSYYRPYCDLIGTFVREQRSDLVVPKYLDKNLVSLTIDPKYRAATESWDLYVKQRVNEPWWAHYQIMRLTSGVLDLPDKKLYFKDDNFVDTLYKTGFNELGRGIKLSFLNKNKFTEWIKILHDYIIPRLAKLNKDKGGIFSGFKAMILGGDKMTKRERDKEFNRLKKVCDLSTKQESLLRILFDFRPHDTKNLESDVPTKALSHLKDSLNGNIKREAYTIDSKLGGPLDKSFYTLRKIIDENK